MMKYRLYTFILTHETYNYCVKIRLSEKEDKNLIM